MNGSDYGQIPFADEIKALIDILDAKIVTLNSTISSLETVITSLETDLEAYGFEYLFKHWKWIASDDLEKSSDSVVTTTSQPYVKLKEITFSPTPSRSVSDEASIFRISFEMKGYSGPGSTSYHPWGRIYRDGSPVGTEWNAIDDETYHVYSQDISGWAPGDKIQLYGREMAGYGNPGYFRNFRIYGKTDGITYPEPTW